MYKPPKIREQVKTALTRAEHTVRSYFYDGRHRKEAMDVVAYLERYGDTKLTPQIRKTADNYAMETFGSKRFAPLALRLHAHSRQLSGRLVAGQFLRKDCFTSSKFQAINYW